MVITIIVLLILAGVALATILGDGNIIGNAENVVGRYNNGVIVEQQLLNEIEGYLSSSIDRLEKIPVYTEEQLQKMGSGEDVIINGRIYNFGTGKTYVLQNNIEYAGTYENIGNLIKNKEIYIEGQNKIIKVTNEEGIDEYYTEESKYYIATNKYGYVLNGLELYYDGIDNTGSGHSTTVTTWTDLSGKGRNGTLKNMTSSSAWTEEGLVFDGINDYVLIQELNYDNVTLETVIESNRAGSSKAQVMLGNLEQGGYGIYYTTRVTFEAYIKEENDYATPDYKSNMPMNISQGYRYSISGCYNGKRVFTRLDGQYQYKDVEGTIKMPERNTKFILGGNPYEGTMNMDAFEGVIYSTRVYSRALSDEEMSINYLTDKERYNL